jgi:hypothetical protein
MCVILTLSTIEPMKNIAYILILLSLQSCSQTNTDKIKKESENIVINLVGDSIQVFDDSQSGNFFKVLYEKYNNDYYPLGSGITFSEGITTSEPDSYHSKSAFLIVDSGLTPYKSDKIHLFNNNTKNSS